MSQSSYSIRVAAWSDQGRERDYQEDNYCVGANPEFNSWVMPQDAFSPGNYGVLLVVADGMGGLNAGEVASMLAVEGVKEYFGPGRLSGGVETLNPGALLRECVLYANSKIVEHARRNPDTEGMGTTLVIAWMLGSTVYIGWSGDSRCYLLRQGNIRQVNRDHSYVQELVDNKTITEEEAFYHPNKNIITQSLGDVGKPPEPEFAYAPLEPGDRVLVCSDGLNSMLHDHEIASILAAGDVGYATRALVDAANEAGGHDNITVVIGEMQGEVSAATPFVETNAPELGKVFAPVSSQPVGGGLKGMSTSMKAALLIVIPVIIALAVFSIIGMLKDPVDHTLPNESNQSRHDSINVNNKNDSIISNLNETNTGENIIRQNRANTPRANNNTPPPKDKELQSDTIVTKEGYLKVLVGKKISDLLKIHTAGVCKDRLIKIEKSLKDDDFSVIRERICNRESKGCGFDELKKICECNVIIESNLSSDINLDRINNKNQPIIINEPPESSENKSTTKFGIQLILVDLNKKNDAENLKDKPVYKNYKIEIKKIIYIDKKNKTKEGWIALVEGFSNFNEASERAKELGRGIQGNNKPFAIIYENLPDGSIKKIKTQ